MSKNTLSVLIIEDHPLIINAYENALNQVKTNNKSLKLHVDIAINCDTAITKL